MNGLHSPHDSPSFSSFFPSFCSSGESKVHDRNEYSLICARSVASFHVCNFEERGRSPGDSVAHSSRVSRFYSSATNEARSLLRYCASTWISFLQHFNDCSARARARLKSILKIADRLYTTLQLYNIKNKMFHIFKDS